MFFNYLKIAFRSILKNRAYTFINVAGLSAAFLCAFLILIHVKNELSYDADFPQSRNLYRLVMDTRSGGTVRHWAQTPPPLGPMIEDALPEIIRTARLRHVSSMILSRAEGGTVNQFKEEGGFFADQALVDLFDLRFISGDRQTSLTEINTIVLSRSMAERYFGGENPVGKFLNDDNASLQYRVTGVIADMPKNTHLQFDYLVSMPTFYRSMNHHPLLRSRTWKAMYTYVLLDANREAESMEPRLADFMNHSFTSGFEQTLHDQPIGDIHLTSHLEKELGPNGNITYIYIFAAAGVLLLIIATVNFVNLSMAQALQRSREVGMRKVLGAHKRQLIGQFLGESVFLVFISSLVSLFLLDLVLPLYNALSGKDFVYARLLSFENMTLMFILVAATALLAGLYPALFVSGLRPLSSFKSGGTSPSPVTKVRKGLVVFQFVISIFMTFCSIVIYQQLLFLKEKDLGFDREQLMAVPVFRNLMANIDPADIKNELLRNTSISDVSFMSTLPGDRMSVEHLKPSSIAKNEEVPGVRIIQADEDLLKTLRVPLISGRDFQKRSGGMYQFLVSETAVQALGLHHPVGKKANHYGKEGEIIGVFRDFHFASLHDAIEPLVLEYEPGQADNLLIRYRGSERTHILALVETTFRKAAPNHPFTYSFLDDNLSRLYVSEHRLGDIFEIFTYVTIFVACLGLFGFSVYIGEIKTREVGIRKVLGASSPGIVFLLSKDFVKLVLAANILAWPAAYFAMNRWLSDFAYGTDISWWVFALAGGLALVVSLLTVSVQAFKSAMANPVDSLRYE